MNGVPSSLPGASDGPPVAWGPRLPGVLDAVGVPADALDAPALGEVPGGLDEVAPVVGTALGEVLGVGDLLGVLLAVLLGVGETPGVGEEEVGLGVGLGDGQFVTVNRDCAWDPDTGMPPDVAMNA